MVTQTTDEPAAVGELAEAVDLRERAERMAARAAAGDLPPPPDDPGADAGWDDDPRPWPPRGIPARFAGAHVDQLDGDLADLAAEWSGALDRNVLLLGDVGTGKTHTAVALARIAHEQSRAVLFVPTVELLDAMRPNGDPDLVGRATSVDVLILDDLGTERPTDWTGERLYALINRRWLECRPTIVTANLDPSVLEQAVGRAAFSRLYHDALRASVGGDDRRRSS